MTSIFFADTSDITDVNMLHLTTKYQLPIVKNKKFQRYDRNGIIFSMHDQTLQLEAKGESTSNKNFKMLAWGVSQLLLLL